MRLYLVNWVDAAGGELQGWRPLTSMIATEPHICQSVGFLLHKTDSTLVLVPHIAGGDQGDGEIIIPMPWVQHIVELGPKQDAFMAASSDKVEDKENG